MKILFTIIWISICIYTDYKELQAFRQDNSVIDLSDAGKLYDYLTENIN